MLSNKYHEYEAYFKQVSDEEVLQGFHAKPNLKAEVASEEAEKRNLLPMVVDWIRNRKFTTKVANTIAFNFILSFGKKFTESKYICLDFLKEPKNRKSKVSHHALWGIVFHQDKLLIPELEQLKECYKEDLKDYQNFELAIRSLQEENPFLFSPGYCDSSGSWELSRAKYGKRAGDDTPEMIEEKHREYEEYFKEFSDEEVLADFNDKTSTKHDAAIYIAKKRELYNLAGQWIRDGKFTTSYANHVALNYISLIGKKFTDSKLICLDYLKEQNNRQFDNTCSALWIIVFHQDKSLVPELVKLKESFKDNPKDYQQFQLAIKSLQKENPFLFSPGHCDYTGRWELSKSKYGSKAGDSQTP